MARKGSLLSRRSLAQREELAFYLFASPWLIGFVLWTAGPMLASFLLSFARYDVITRPTWNGLNNYAVLFAHDPLVWQSLKVTLYYALGAVPLALVVAMLLALLMNQKIPGIRVFRTIYYLPAVVSGVPVALLWVWILNGQFGVLNTLLGVIGIQGPDWLFSITWVIPAFIIMSLWTVGGPMIIYLAGLQGIPQHLYESAEIDGAGPWAKFAHVTIPMISPVLFFNAIMGLIGSLQIFTPAFVMTGGGPLNASLFVGLYLYRNAFQYFQMGYASAMAWLVFVIIMALVLLVIRSSPYWVYYEAGPTGGKR